MHLFCRREGAWSLHITEGLKTCTLSVYTVTILRERSSRLQTPSLTAPVLLFLNIPHSYIIPISPALLFLNMLHSKITFSSSEDPSLENISIYDTNIDYSKLKPIKFTV